MNTYYVFSWTNVGDHAVPSSTSDFQLEFNVRNGQVHMHWGAVSLTGGDHLVGYSPGGASTDPGSSDLNSIPLQPLPTCGDREPLTLAAVGRPIVPSLFDLVVSHVPDSPNPNLVVIFLGNQLTPGLSLAGFGAPTCFAQILGFDPLFALFGHDALTQPVMIPQIPAWLGARIYLQAAAVTDENSFGWVTSNGLQLIFGAQ